MGWTILVVGAQFKKGQEVSWWITLIIVVDGSGIREESQSVYLGVVVSERLSVGRVPEPELLGMVEHLEVVVT